jgi:hypothetical protein
VMKRNAQITLNWKQLHHEMLKLREYVEWWDAAMKWRIEKISDHVIQHHLIFICMYETTWFSADMQRLDSDQSLWDRFVSSICWLRNEAVLQLSNELILRRWSRDQASQARSYEDGRWVKHSRHDQAGDDRARRALNETVKPS